MSFLDGVTAADDESDEVSLSDELDDLLSLD
jgi:hypothetical protein